VLNRKNYVLFALLIASTFLSPKIVAAKSAVLNARSAILVDLSGAVLFEQNADAPIPPASITKVLTLYLALEAIEGGRARPTDLVTVSRKAAGAPPTRMGLKAGERVSLGELLKGAGVGSGNDAAMALAEYLGGSEKRFVALMNLKAKQLGMWGSHFVNPSGLPASAQITTARDVAKLSIAYLRRFPEALDIHCRQKYTYKKVTHRNPNRLLGSCPGVDGLKTGFVNASRYNISATAARGGKRLIAVVLGASTPGVRTAETTRLLEYGYTGAFPKATAMAKNTRSKSKTKSAAATKAVKRAKAKKPGVTSKKKVASTKQAKGKTVAKQANSKVKTKASSKAAKQTKKVASTAKAKGKTTATQVNSKVKQERSPEAAKQTKVASKNDKPVDAKEQEKTKGKSSVRKKIEKPSPEKKTADPTQT